MENEFKAWKQDPNETNFDKLMGKVKPVINNAVSLYVGGDHSAARSKAKVLTSKALKNYDPEKGTKLKTYLMVQMQPLRRFAAKTRTLTNIPERAQRESATIDTVYRELEDKLDRSPSDVELADHTGFSVKKIQYLRRFNKPTSESSVDYSPVTSKVNPEDVWADYVYYDLGNVDRKIFEWRTGYGGHKMLSTNDIAKRLKLTPAAVSQRVATITKKLQEGSRYGY